MNPKDRILLTLAVIVGVIFGLLGYAQWVSTLSDEDYWKCVKGGIC